MTGSARAGIHTPCPIILDAEAEAFCPNKRRWLWVPAFAGTTQEDSNVRQQTQHCDPAARCVRAVHELFRPEERAQGNAGCPLHPQSVCKGRKHTGVTTGTPEHPAFPAQWFYGLFRALPGDRALLPPSPADRSASLTPASGRQDHTASPSATGVSSSAPSHAQRRCVHRIPHPTSVTIAIRPSLGVGRGSSRCDLGQSKTRIFLQTGLDRKITSKPVGQISKQLPGGVAVADYATLISPTGYDCSLDGNTDQEMIVVARHRTKRQRYSICPGAAAAMIRISLIAALACCTATMAAAADDLYRAQTIVTGQSEANRIIGFASCLEDDLIKVSGAQKLAGDPRLAAYKSSVGDFVKAHSYHDQMSGTPTGDEQGTRDRPYDLIVDFDEDKIDDILSALGLKPWLSHRPVLGVFVEMEQGPRKYIVTADAKQSDLQRESLLAAAAKRGGPSCCRALQHWRNRASMLRSSAR